MMPRIMTPPWVILNSPNTWTAKQDFQGTTAIRFGTTSPVRVHWGAASRLAIFQDDNATYAEIAASSFIQPNTGSLFNSAGLLLRDSDIRTYDADGQTIPVLVRDTGVGMVTILSFVGAADPNILMGNAGNAFQISYAGLVGFYGTAPQAKPTGVAITAAGIHAALVTLGLIAA